MRNHGVMSKDRAVIFNEASERQSYDKRYRSVGVLKFRLWTSLSSKKAHLTVVVLVVLVLRVFLSRAQRPVCFYDVDNYTGAVSYVVPNVIHYVRFGQPNVSFMDAVSMRSAYINHAPDKIVVHCDECQLGGPLAYLVRGIPNVTITKRRPAETIFGREVGCIEHASDVARMQILLEHGGIYLDNDCIVIQPLHQFRHFEMSIGWPPDAYLGTMVLLAAPRARFLRLHLELYREYNSSLWYYNAGDLPTMRLLWPHPHLVHAVPVLFGVDMDMLSKLYTPGDHPEWRSYFAVHTFVNHRSVKEDPLYGREIDLQNVRTYNTSLGEMIREVLFGTSAFVSNDTEVRPVTDLYAAKLLALQSRDG
ncbi:uncharacterized protein LOC135368930 isoform X1 [Ornithodoros turicata]|uniref:uncharacterized protein LOC135368930 isoform X1 n=1 Tax=Ornithodoros turicata TaxID=34597 RepID=UPI003138E833